MKKNPKTLSQIWAQVPPGYYQKGNFLQSLWHKNKLKVFKKLILGNEEMVLDVGCADGHLIGRLSQFLPKSRIFALDVSKKLILSAKKKYKNISFLVADSHHLPFPDKTFDLVFCTETIEHVVSPKRVLSEIKRVLKPEGKLIIEMDSGSLLFRLVWFFWTRFGKGRVWQDAHLNRLDAKRLEELIKKSGFSIEKTIYSHFGMAVTFLAKIKS